MGPHISARWTWDEYRGIQLAASTPITSMASAERSRGVVSDDDRSLSVILSEPGGRHSTQCPALPPPIVGLICVSCCRSLCASWSKRGQHA